MTADLRARCANLPAPAQAELKAAWWKHPELGQTTFATATPEQLAVIGGLVAELEGRYLPKANGAPGQPLPGAPAPAAAPPASEPFPADGGRPIEPEQLALLKAGIDALPPDLADKVRSAITAAGKFPDQLDNQPPATQVHGIRWLGFVETAKEEWVARHGRLMGVLEAEQWDDDMRHAGAHLVSAGRTRSSRDLTADETQQLIDLTVRVAAGTLTLRYNPDGVPQWVALDGEVNPELPHPAKVPTDASGWKALGVDHKWSSRKVLDRAKKIAEQLGEKPPTNLGNVGGRVGRLLAEEIVRSPDGGPPVDAAVTATPAATEPNPQPPAEPAAPEPAPAVIEAEATVHPAAGNLPPLAGERLGERPPYEPYDLANLVRAVNFARLIVVQVDKIDSEWCLIGYRDSVDDQTDGILVAGPFGSLEVAALALSAVITGQQGWAVTMPGRRISRAE